MDNNKYHSNNDLNTKVIIFRGFDIKKLIFGKKYMNFGILLRINMSLNFLW